MVSSQKLLPTTCCSRTCRHVLFSRDAISPPPAVAQVPAGPVVFFGTLCLQLLRDFQDLFCCLGTHCPLFRDLQVLWCCLGTPCRCLPLLRDLQDLCCPLGIHCPVCCCSVTSRTCIVASGPPPFCSGTRRTCAVISGPTTPCLPLIREIQDLWYSLGIPWPLPAASQ